MRLILPIYLCLLITKCMGQSTASTFNFWLGNWDAYTNDTLKARNSIKKSFDGRVIEEDFRFVDSSFYGKSWSVFDTITKQWNQTWVDNEGSYMTFTGGSQAGSVIMTRTNPRVKNNKTYFMRMKFMNINEKSFTWLWERSTDNVSWVEVWTIQYKKQTLGND